MRKGMIAILAVSCAGCVSAVSDGFDNVPEWFEERRDELNGEGYPSLKATENLKKDENSVPWSKIENDIAVGVRDLKKNDPGTVTITEAEMRAWAAKQKALVDKGEEPY
jgi:hypothetical protein